MNDFNDLYVSQVDFQKFVLEKIGYFGKQETNPQIPRDDINLFSFHIQQLMSEIGEVLTADKRWKSHRKDNFDVENKKEEIADCFVVLLNIAIYSGINADELFEAILNKIKKNRERERERERE
jgi:NTP pyrophosphatase (non-canonical NTP hydrolase)